MYYIYTCTCTCGFTGPSAGAFLVPIPGTLATTAPDDWRPCNVDGLTFVSAATLKACFSLSWSNIFK